MRIYINKVYSMVKTKVTISLDGKKWTDFRIACLRDKITASELIEQFIDKFLKKEKQ